MVGVKNLVIEKHNLPITKIMDNIMEQKQSKFTDEYKYLDTTIKYSLVCIIFINLSILICIVAVDKDGKANAFCGCKYTSFIIALKFYMNHGCKGITSPLELLVHCQLQL